MTATKPHRNPPTHNELAPDYEQVRDVVLNWPPTAQAQLIQDMFNRLIGTDYTPLDMHRVKENGSEDAEALLRPATNEEVQERIARGLITEPPPVGKRNSMALLGLLHYEGPEISDEELDNMLAQARLERYAPELLPTPIEET